MKRNAARIGWRVPGRSLGLAAFVLLAACAVAPPAAFRAPGQAIELAQTPYFAQTEYHCGPAALATVLAAEGLSVTPDALSPLIYLPGRKGSLQAEIVAAARAFDRLPLRLGPDPEDLIAALKAGKPVLVLQNLGLRSWPIWHYAVLIGYEPEHARFLLRSGATRRQTMGAARFLASWDRADNWALVLAAADAVPDFARPGSWLAAAAPFESLGRIGTADRAYRAAVQRWPDSALAWQALANARYAQADRPGAEAALRRAIELDPRAVAARNNLADLLLQRGCPRAARAQLEAVGEIPEPLRKAVMETRAAVDATTAVDAADCPL